MPRLATIALVALLPATLWAADNHNHDDSHGNDAHLSEAEGLRVVHAWTRAATGDTADVFVEIENTRADRAVLLGGDAEIAGSVILLATPLRSDRTEPEPVEAIPVAPGATLELTPGGLFLRLRDVTMPRIEGEGFTMHLVFDGIPEVEVHVDVEAADADAHSHAGHAH